MFSTPIGAFSAQTKLPVIQKAGSNIQSKPTFSSGGSDSVHFGRMPKGPKEWTLAGGALVLTAAAIGAPIAAIVNSDDASNTNASTSTESTQATGQSSPQASPQTTEEAAPSPIESTNKPGGTTTNPSSQPMINPDRKQSGNDYHDDFKRIDTNRWGYGYDQFWASPNANMDNGDISLNADRINGIPLSKAFQTGNGLKMNCFPLDEPKVENGRTFTQGCGSLTSKPFQTGDDGFTVVFKDVDLTGVLGKKVLPALWVISTDGRVELDLMEHVDPNPNTLYSNFHLDYEEVGNGETSVGPGFFHEKHDYALTVTPGKNGAQATATWYMVDQGKLIKLRSIQTDRITADTQFVSKMDIAVHPEGTPWTDGPAKPVNASWTVGSYSFYQGNAINPKAVVNP